MRRYFILIIGALVVFSLALFTFKQFQIATLGENCLTGLNSGIDLPTSVKNLLNEEAFEVIDTEIYDLSGRRINRSIEALSAGQYIVVKIGKNGELKSEKIFVTK